MAIVKPSGFYDSNIDCRLVSALRALSRWGRCIFAVLIFVGIAKAQDAGSVKLVEQAPVRIERVASDTFLVDFGRVAFGNLLLRPGARSQTGTNTITIRFGEALKNSRVNVHPPGSVRFAEVKARLSGAPLIVEPPANDRNSKGTAVLTPSTWGVLMPFRWVEVKGWTKGLRADEIRRRAAFDTTWSDDAATFNSSDAMLDRVWNLCHYTIKAATFAGVFIDGDRERRAYEADAYLTQLSYYAGDAEPRLPRASFDRLMAYPTWPSEWAPQMVLMAYADWMHNGDRDWLAAHYESLKSKLLAARVGSDGLVMSSSEMMRKNDIVDWPQSERDGYVFTSVNTVVNAFRLQALKDMTILATALGKTEEAEAFRREEQAGQAAFQERLFDSSCGLYRDGVGTDHESLHANLFALAFGLVPVDERPHVAQWLVSRGMAGSVYAAQYLLEGLFANDEDVAAIGLIVAPGDRSWRHMVDSGATMTWEAWDQRYKPNQDWNHAWGAAPANILPRYVLGAQPLTPGWGTALIQPHTGGLSHAQGRIPTPLGELSVSWMRTKRAFILNAQIPRGMTAKVALPTWEGSSAILVDGKEVKAHKHGSWWILDNALSGSAEIREQ
jgi:alpha-L-rhamnosidase